MYIEIDFLCTIYIQSEQNGICEDDDYDPSEVLFSPVWGYFPDCSEYPGGLSHNRPRKCCHGIRKLNEIAKTSKKDRGGLLLLWSLYGYSRFSIKELPKKCHTNVLFPISERMNCSYVKLVISFSCSRSLKYVTCLLFLAFYFSGLT